MSQSDDIDTDIDTDANQEPEQDPGQPQEEQMPEESEPKKPIGGLVLKVVVALAVLGGAAAFYFLKPSAVQSPITAATTPSAPMPAPLGSPGAKLADTAAIPSAPPQETPPASSANEDPLAWGEPVAPAIPAAPSMPAAVTATPSIPATPSTADEIPAEKKTEATKVISGDAAATQEKIAVLEKRLTELEEKISSLQASTLTKDSIEALEVTVGKLQQDAEEARAEKEKIEKEKAEKAKMAAAKAKKTKAATAARETRPAPSATPDWILKSAKPGMAWVGKRDSRELNTVSVGDTLPGIGIITAIIKDSAGRWVVSGTNGTISQ